jgi:hypothetical protein
LLNGPESLCSICGIAAVRVVLRGLLPEGLFDIGKLGIAVQAQGGVVVRHIGG